MSKGTLDDVFIRLLDAADVPGDARAALLAQLQRLQERFPQETPARLLHRARREGAAIPTSRCPHGIARNDCVECDGRIGGRLYFTAGGAHVHTTPLCRALGTEADGGTKGGSARLAISVVSAADLAPAGERVPCPVCVKASTRARASRRAS